MELGGNDLVGLNFGGKEILTVKRSLLTQVAKGTLLEALFSGRHEGRDASPGHEAHVQVIRVRRNLSRVATSKLAYSNWSKPKGVTREGTPATGATHRYCDVIHSAPGLVNGVILRPHVL